MASAGARQRTSDTYLPVCRVYSFPFPTSSSGPQISIFPPKFTLDIEHSGFLKGVRLEENPHGPPGLVPRAGLLLSHGQPHVSDDLPLWATACDLSRLLSWPATRRRRVSLGNPHALPRLRLFFIAFGRAFFFFFPINKDKARK